MSEIIQEVQKVGGGRKYAFNRVGVYRFTRRKHTYKEIWK